MDTKRLPRLIAIDNRLAGEGLHLQTAAQDLGVTVRTLWRDLEILRDAGCEIECRIVGSRYLHFHVGDRLFNASHDDSTEAVAEEADSEESESSESPSDEFPCEHHVH